MRKWLALSLFCLLSAAQAAIYMQTDANGNTVYSDTKDSPAAKIVVVSPSGGGSSGVSTPAAVSISLPVKAVETVAAVNESGDARSEYTDFRIISPVNNETIQNPVTINVKFDIKPSLQTGDKVQLFLDNKPAGEAVAGTSGILPWVERGSHQVSAVIIDANQKVIKSSNSITINVQRVGLNSPARQQSSGKKEDHKMLPLVQAS